MDRIILHCDLNSFYASVELRSRPDLQNVPVAVCGDPTSRHGIILAKNEAAKKFQVKTAETIWQARRKCPDLALLRAHHWKYRDYSKQVNAIYERHFGPDFPARSCVEVSRLPAGARVEVELICEKV